MALIVKAVTDNYLDNERLVRARLPPLYIKVEEKADYIKALERADRTGDYDDLYEVIFRTLLKCHVDLRDRFLSNKHK